MCIGYDPFRWADNFINEEEYMENSEMVTKIEIDLEAITNEMDSLKDQKARLEFELKNTKQCIEILEMQLSALLNQQAVNEMNYGVYRFGFETKTRTALDQAYLKEHYADIAQKCTFTKEKQDFYFKINK